ncbi:solute carrier family 35 member E3 [Aspergillus udagawae]|uniref:GDP-mannose transporter n=1 Tax=Aspergillus udagawae TaxID=91492 RepID=A0ABQ1A6U9_9EURO|nr:solute carrier family 35 member E3 [Aspergillus udagawae]GFG12201.1 solute carrier family 35 member E3 [Aspergillus udagawae]
MVVSLAANVSPNGEKAIEQLKPWPFSWWLKSPLNLREILGQKDNNGARLGIWTMVNIVSTVAIIFTNKSIFVNESFGNCQIAFASYHFFVTGFTLWMASRPWCGVFTAKRVPVHQTLHLAVLMCLQVILQNLSLAYSSVIFHQLVRLLLTPLTALLNYLLYRARIPTASIIPLMVLCGGVGTMSYYDALPRTDGKVTASSKGAVFAFTGVIASALYTAFVGRYHRKFEIGSVQLLLNQAPLSAAILLCVVPFAETLPATAGFSRSLYVSIMAVILPSPDPSYCTVLLQR